MKHFITVGIIILLLLGLGVYWWTISPTGRINEANTINPKISLFSEEWNCSLLNDLLNSEFIVDYPKAVGYKETGVVNVTIANSLRKIESDNIDSSVPCTISLEVSVDIKEMIIEPGKRSIESYSGAPFQNFIFKISPLGDGEEKGTIWIHANISNWGGTKVERIPLFAVPFTTRVKSFFGIPPGSIRIICAVITALAGLYLIFQEKLNKNRK